jgi:ubiquinone/menaquinone biosynthesis C-methylase UbiE
VLEIGAVPSGDSLLTMPALAGAVERVGLNLDGPHRYGGFEIHKGDANRMDCFEDAGAMGGRRAGWRRRAPARRPRRIRRLVARSKAMTARSGASDTIRSRARTRPAGRASEAFMSRPSPQAAVRAWVRATALVLVLCSSGSTVAGGEAPADENTDDVRRLVRSLGLRAGMTVAEIGAGDGALSIGVARELGPTARLFASELGADHLRALREAVERAQAVTITVVEAETEHAALPEACCDAIFMRDVYHHFSDPVTMNESLRQSLKPCGRLAVIDFTPPPGQEQATPVGRGGTTHGMSLRSLSAELARAGFEIVSEETLSRRNFMILARRPGSDASPSQTCADQGSKKS